MSLPPSGAIVIADTSPLCYLILIEESDLLHLLFAKVIIPETVAAELAAADAPASVQQWIASPPEWLHVVPSPTIAAGLDTSLDRGEYDALGLAVVSMADVVLMDDRKGVAEARRMGFRVFGTVGVLGLAAESQHVDLQKAFDKLLRTSFRAPHAVMNDLLAKHRR